MKGTDGELILLYQDLINKGRLSPDGAGFRRMEYLKKRMIRKRYDRVMKGFKSDNGVAQLSEP